MKIPLILIGLCIITSVGFSAFFYSDMPAEMDSHWNVFGDADNIISKTWGLFLIPIFLVLMLFQGLFISYVKNTDRRYMVDFFHEFLFLIITDVH